MNDSLTSVRSQRGLLIAACLFVAVLVGGMLIRPTPTHNNDEVSELDRDDISAKGPPSTETFSGASSREAEAPSTTVIGEEASVQQPLPFTVHDVANVDQWNAAVAAAEPGDTIKLVSTINSILQYRGSRAQPERSVGGGGTGERPITITAAPDVWIDPGDLNNNKPALDIMFTSHVNVVGVRIRNSQFGLRVQYSNGTSESPILIVDNLVTDIGHAGIHITGDLQTHSPSQHVRVDSNTVTRTGLTAPQFGEGIYLGYGSQEWVDNTSDVQVLNNEISYTTAEAIDVKPGTRNVLVDGNLIHDLSPIRGGAISGHYVGIAPNPDPGLNANLTIRNNRIWNMNLDGRSGANDWAIWVGHGGVTIENNAIWGLRGDPNQTRAVRVRALHDFGPHPIRIVDNIFWTATGWLAEGSPSGAGSVRAEGNRGPAGALGIDQPLSPGAAVPPVGTGGSADQGLGPGSALGFRNLQATLSEGFEPGVAG